MKVIEKGRGKWEEINESQCKKNSQQAEESKRSDIIKVTGHRNVQSLDDYNEADEVEQRQLSLAISKRNYENPLVEKNAIAASSITTTGHPLLPTKLNLPVQTTAGPSMAQSKENYVQGL